MILDASDANVDAGGDAVEGLGSDGRGCYTLGMAHPYAVVVQENASTARREEHLVQLESETRECCLVQDHASDGHCASEKGDESVQVEEPSALERVC